MSSFNSSNSALHGTGKRTACVPKQLGLKKRLGNCRTVERDKRPRRTLAQPVQSARHKLLTRSCWTLNQNRRSMWSGEPNASTYLKYHRMLPDKFRQPSRVAFGPGTGGLTSFLRR